MTFIRPEQRYSAKMRDMTPYLDIEKLWEQGIHVSSTGKQCNLSDISPSYLQNIINKFSALGYDTSALGAYSQTSEDAIPNSGPISQASL